MQLAKRQLAVAVASALFQPNFVWDLSKGSIVPARGATWANVTHTRATVGTFDDQDSMVRTALSGEARFRGLRRTRNLLRFPENFSNAAWLTTGPAVAMTPNMSAPDLTLTATRMTQTAVGTLAGVFQSPAATSGTFRPSVWLRRVAGSAAVILRTPTNGDYDISATLTSSWQRFTSTAAAPFGGNAYFVILLNAQNDAIDMWHPQLEDVSGQAVQNPAEYSSVDVLAAPFQGANVDGVKYFPTHNGNVVQQNLFARSQALNTAPWTDPGGALTVTENNAVAPDGTNTGTTFAYNGSATGGRFQTLASYTIGQVYTFSVYAKSVASSNVILRVGSDTVSDNACSFNLRAGTVTNIGNGVGTITPVGNGWFRCTTALTALSATLGGILYVANMVAGETLALWGAQVQPGRRAGTYVATTAAAINNNIVEESIGDTISGNPGYFREDGRTNLILQSEDFSNASWVKTDTVITADNTVGPDGKTTADLLTEGVAGTAGVQQTVTATANANYAATLWVKRGNTDWLMVRISAVGASCDAWFNLNTGALGSSTPGGTAAFVAKAITAYPNGWYRVTLVASMGGAQTSISLLTLNTSADAVSTRVNNATRFQWGAQFEDNTSWPSSYLPTVAATVTRNTDVLLCSGLGAYFTADASWYAEMISDQTVNSNPRVIGVTGVKGVLTHNSNVVAAGPGLYGASLWDNAAATSSVNNVNTGVLAKMCSKYTIGVNAAKACLNGGAVASGNTNAFSGETTIGVGTTNVGGATGFYGVVRKVHGWQRQIPDAYMQRITA